MKKHYIIPIFVPHLGCPHDCVFCNQKRITNQITDVTKEDVKNTIEEYLSYFKEDSFIEVAFYGGSFTAIDIDVQRELLSVPFEYKKKGIIDEIRMSTRPDCIDDNILKHLKEFDVDTVELGVQSLDEKVLKASGRGHDGKSVYEAVDMLKSYGIKYGLQMMLGLPEDSMRADLFTTSEFIKLNPDCVRIYPTLVIKDTYMARQLEEGTYKPLDLEEAVDRSSIILMLYYLNDINVIRVGLQPTENIQLGKDVVDGPFHPAFRQLVESNIYKHMISSFLLSKKIETKGLDMTIYSNMRNISNISGQKSKNVNFFKNEFRFKDISLRANKEDENIIKLQIEDEIYKLDREKSMKRFIIDYISKNNEFKLEDFNLSD